MDCQSLQHEVQDAHANHPVRPCSKVEQGQFNTSASFRSAATLAALVGVNHHLLFQFTPSDCHQ